jgi:ParB family transcriptional regulator, chromosome partitioning protein
MQRHQLWAEQIPDRDELWRWIQKLPQESKLELLGYLVARTVNAMDSRVNGHQGHITMLAKATCLDMTKWWSVSRSTYLDRVSKQAIVGVVSEAVSPSASQDIAHLKKAVMAARAEDLLKKTKWLPPLLRITTHEEDGLKQSA